MSKKVTSALVRKEYQKHIAAFAKCIGDATLRLRFMVSADAYYRRCAICVWGSAGADSGPVNESHVEAYNAIVSKGSTGENALYFQVFTQVNDKPRFEAPPFFAALVAYDDACGADLTGKFIELTHLLMLLFAAIDDRVSQQESDYVEECSAYLKGVAAGAIQPGKKAPVAPGAFAPAGANTAAQTEAKAEEPKEERPEPPKETVEELLARLDSLCGLDQIKKDVRSLVNLVKVRKLRQQMELPVPDMSLHMVFMGNPGTGKTTVARLLAKLYHAIGVLEKGQLVEVDRSGLVAGYVGQTAIKTQEVITSALGGVLFIDEAYALTSQKGENDFGKEAIEVLLKNMEDHRDELVVIVAGYTDLMGEFIRSNPGLESRFNKYMYFEDYTGDQLWEIFASQCSRNSYVPGEGVEEFGRTFFTRLFEERDENFGNARDVRNIFEKLVSVQSDRVSQLEAPTREQLMEITLEDFKKAAEEE